MSAEAPASPHTWLYAVLAEGPGQRPELPPLAGVAGEGVRLLAVADLSAAVGSVPAPEYGDAALQSRLDDLPWLEAAVRAHHHVVETLWQARRAALLPMRFATVYRDDERAAAALAGRRAELAAALDRVGDRTEWGVKAFPDPSAAAAQAADAEGATADPSARAEAAGRPARSADRPGTAYLQRRRAQRDRQEHTLGDALAAAAELHAALAALAADARQHPPHRSEPMVLNGAYLVDRARGGDFRAAVTAAASRFPALRVELTGPWPPYSFADQAPPGR